MSAIGVTGSLTRISGAVNQQFFDNGATGGGQTANDNVFSFPATVAAGTIAGAKNIVVAVSDGQNLLADDPAQTVPGGGAGGDDHGRNDGLER